MKTKFKIGDTISFMNENKPKTEKITGIAIYQGDITELNFSNKKDDGVKILYSYATYGSVEEKNAFKTIEDLKTNLFAEKKETK